jgi:threonine synthase
MYTCPHTAVGLAVLEKLIGRGVIRKGDRVACVSTANGLKFTEFKVKYHEGSVPGVTGKMKNPPVLLPPSFDKVVDAITHRFA